MFAYRKARGREKNPGGTGPQARGGRSQEEVRGGGEKKNRGGKVESGRRKETL